MATPKHLQRPTPQYDFQVVLEPLPEEQPQPHAVVQRQSSNQKATAQPFRSPITRGTIRTYEPLYWLVLALGAFAVSAVSTVMQVIKLFDIAGATLPLAAVAVIGGTIAFVIFLGELLTNDRPFVYGCFLMVDIAFTLTWSWPAFYRLSSAAGAGMWGAAILGALIAWFCAWLPERVLLGRRAI